MPSRANPPPTFGLPAVPLIAPPSTLARVKSVSGASLAPLANWATTQFPEVDEIVAEEAGATRFTS